MIPAMTFQPWPEDLLHKLRRFPWRDTALTLRQRFREDRMGLAASSLTFTTSIALVPFFTVALAVFTAFPMFSKLQGLLQVWLVESLIPENIARQVLGYLTQFTRQASRLGFAGLAVLVVTAVALVLTIDRTLNAIWRVRQPRPLAQRLLIYWAAVTLGPLLLASSLAATSYVLPLVRGVDVAPTTVVQFIIDTLEFLALSGAMAALYHFMPNTYVKWSHAWAGGMFVAVGMAVAKKLLGLYLQSVPTYSVVYGAFATVPILLVWIYMAWLIVLFGAVITAYLPSLMLGVGRRGTGPGFGFELALDTLRLLSQARSSPERGLLALALSERLRTDHLQIERVLDELVQLRWVGQLATQDADVEPVFVLLAEPELTMLEPLADRLLLNPSEATAKVRLAAAWHRTPLSAVL
jgi:membrane protein